MTLGGELVFIARLAASRNLDEAPNLLPHLAKRGRVAGALGGFHDFREPQRPLPALPRFAGEGGRCVMRGAGFRYAACRFAESA